MLPVEGAPGPVAPLVGSGDGSRARADDARLGAMVRDHLEFTWRSLRRLGLPADLADDAVQRVFLVASARLSDIEPGRERAFLFNTALRVASSEKRSFARRREVPGGEALEQARDAAPGADEQLDRHRAREVLEDLLRGLDLDLRAVFVLYELEEMSTAEESRRPSRSRQGRCRRVCDERARSSRLRRDVSGRASARGAEARDERSGEATRGSQSVRERGARVGAR